MNKAVSLFALYLPGLNLAGMLFVGLVFVVDDADAQDFFGVMLKNSQIISLPDLCGRTFGVAF